MAYELKLPDLGEGLVAAEVVRWLVGEGEQVEEDQPLVEVETDKSTVEIPSPVRGTVGSILIPEGASAAVGAVLIVIDVGAGGQGGVAGQRDNGTLEPAGRQRDGQHAAYGGHHGGGSRTFPGGRASTAPGAELVIRRRQALTGRRREVAEHFGRVQREVPAVTYVEECDFTTLLGDRRPLVAAVVRACASALEQFPELNAHLERDEIIEYESCNVGVAVQTERGLVVPVIRNCRRATCDELDAEITRLTTAARAGQLQARDARGATFTVTSAGKLGGLLVTPLINQPEVAILGLHRIAERAVVREGAIVVRQIGNISLTFDHRAVEGMRAAAFTLAVIALLEQPTRVG